MLACFSLSLKASVARNYQVSYIFTYKYCMYVDVPFGQTMGANILF